VISPTVASSAELQLARYSNTMLDRQFHHGGDGQLFEYELIYYPTRATSAGLKLPQPDSVVGARALGSMGADKEAYRYIYSMKNNREADDYSALMAVLPVFDLPDAQFLAACPDVLDVSQWLRALAFSSLVGSGDNWGVSDGLQHNAQFYVRPSDGRMLFFPHDLDMLRGGGGGRRWGHHGRRALQTEALARNGELLRLIKRPQFKRLFAGHVADLVATGYSAETFGYWLDLAAARLPEQAADMQAAAAYNSARVAHVMSGARGSVLELVPCTAFAVTGQARGPAGQLVLRGDGWVTTDAVVVWLPGGARRLSLCWTGATTWLATLAPAADGAAAGDDAATRGPVVAQAVDRHGAVVGEAALGGWAAPLGRGGTLAGLAEAELATRSGEAWPAGGLAEETRACAAALADPEPYRFCNNDPAPYTACAAPATAFTPCQRATAPPSSPPTAQGAGTRCSVGELTARTAASCPAAAAGALTPPACDARCAAAFGPWWRQCAGAAEAAALDAILDGALTRFGELCAAGAGNGH
jgi:hypothetical protein